MTPGCAKLQGMPELQGMPLKMACNAHSMCQCVARGVTASGCNQIGSHHAGHAIVAGGPAQLMAPDAIVAGGPRPGLTEDSSA